MTALEPLIEACAGVWVAHGSGTADRIVADADDGINVPPARPRYRQRHVWLQPDEERGYYDGFANEGLWPLCHRASVPPVFRSSDFDAYRVVNDRFADAVRDEASSDEPLVLVQDYHFALAPGMTRLLDRLLFDVEPFDPWTFAVTSLVLLAIASIAAFVPARRGMRMAPVDALRTN